VAELSATDVEDFTNGRLTDDGGDGEVTRILTAALAAARRFVGWQVSPVQTGQQLTLDGPGSRILQLPTRNLLALTAVTEDGTDLDTATLNWSATGSVRKQSCLWWTDKYRGIEVTMDHGFTETEAADWRQAILAMVDEMSLLPATPAMTRSGTDLVRKRIDDVEYQWSGAAHNALYSVESILAGYQLPSFPAMFV
jgi:hypothetical protein